MNLPIGATWIDLLDLFDVFIWEMESGKSRTSSRLTFVILHLPLSLLERRLAPEHMQMTAATAEDRSGQ